MRSTLAQLFLPPQLLLVALACRIPSEPHDLQNGTQIALLCKWTYGLSHSLLADCKGLTIYDRTLITSFRQEKRHLQLHTSEGNTIRAKKIIVACGYESSKYLPKKIDQLYTTYALVSEPLPQKEIWYKNALIWETANPYLYFRTQLAATILCDLIKGRNNPDQNLFRFDR